MKKFNLIFNLLIITGILLIVGSAGASDIESITYNELIVQITKGFVIVFSGVLGKWFFAFLKRLSFKKVEKTPENLCIRC